jgi:hypothetical protein
LSQKIELTQGNLEMLHGGSDNNSMAAGDIGDSGSNLENAAATWSADLVDIALRLLGC